MPKCDLFEGPTGLEIRKRMIATDGPQMLQDEKIIVSDLSAFCTGLRGLAVQAQLLVQGSLPATFQLPEPLSAMQDSAAREGF